MKSASVLFTIVQTALRGLATTFAFIIFFVGGAMLSWVWLPIVSVLTRQKEMRIERCQRSVSWGFRIFLGYMHHCRLIRIPRLGLGSATPATGPYVLVANHPTLVDVVALLSDHVPLCCVVKGPLFRNIAVGRLLQSSWHIDGGLGDMHAGIGVLLGALERLEAGLPVLIFPEGTRSTEGSMHAFRQGAFEIACRGKVPLIPVYISCAPPFLSKEAPWYRVPRETPCLSIRPLPAMDPQDWAFDSRAMARDAEAAYRLCMAGEGLPKAWPERLSDTSSHEVPKTPQEAQL